MKYDITDKQKELLRSIVQHDNEGKLFQKGLLKLISGDDKYILWGCSIELESLIDLDTLCDVGLLNKEQAEPDPVYRIKNTAHTAIANEFKMPIVQPSSPVTVGTLIQNMHGGNIQSMGVVHDSEISQIVNDPEALSSQIETLTNKLLSEVKAELGVESYAKYLETTQELKELLKAKKPNPSIIKQLIRNIGFLGDVEGTISLMVRIWPYIYTLLTIVAIRLS